MKLTIDDIASIDVCLNDCSHSKCYLTFTDKQNNIFEFILSNTEAKELQGRFNLILRY